MRNLENNFLEKLDQEKDNEFIDDLQRETFVYFLNEVNPDTGLVADKTMPGFASSIGVTGMAISVYIAGLEKNCITRDDAINRILKILRFFNTSHQGTESFATGYKGFYYHFLEMDTGKRANQCELSTIDSAFLIAGALSAAAYFTGDNKNEKEIRQLAVELYSKVDWQWALNGDVTISHGWTPESGFLSSRWDNTYSEALILYILALGSPTYPIKPEGYKKWLSTFSIKKVYNTEYLYAGPLFIHQFSHMWIDFRGINDDFNKKAGFDYFENSKRATYVHQQYGIQNPKKFTHYGKYLWGLTASDGPGDKEIKIDGIKRTFYGYISRGAPFGPDDGTISPWAVVASLPFAPEIVIDTIRNAVESFNLKRYKLYGLEASFNPTFPDKQKNPNGWVSTYRFGLNQAPVVIMIENYKSELIWNIMKRSPYIIKGLIAAGFTGGWLVGKEEYKTS